MTVLKPELMKAWHFITSTDKAGLFAAPVIFLCSVFICCNNVLKVTEKIAPKYFSIISKPIDLSLIKIKINRGTYKIFSAFDDDIQLMFNNCFTYNAPSSAVHKMAIEMKSAWNTEKLSFANRLYAATPANPELGVVPDVDLVTSIKESNGLMLPTTTKIDELPKSAADPIPSPFALSTDIPVESMSIRLRWALCLLQDKPFLSLLTERFSEILNNTLSRSIDSTDVFRIFDAINLRLIFQLINIVWLNSPGTVPVDVNFFRVILPKLLAILIEKVNEDDFDITLHIKIFADVNSLSPYHVDFLEALVSRIHSNLKKIALSKK